MAILNMSRVGKFWSWYAGRSVHWGHGGDKRGLDWINEACSSRMSLLDSGRIGDKMKMPIASSGCVGEIVWRKVSLGKAWSWCVW